MIVIDTSALIAVIRHEAERPTILKVISSAGHCLLSSVTLLETRMVTFARHGAAGSGLLDAWLAIFSPEIVRFDGAQADAAFLAFQTYGKGIHPTARLNFGDCVSYALAKTRGLPLLFKGADFAATDILQAR